MEDQLIPIYHALTVDDAQRLADILSERGVESFVENTDAPLYGMTQGADAHVVLVYPRAVASAREIVRRFETDWHYGVPRDEQQYEQTGFELPDDPRPSEDSPNEDLDVGMERRDMERPGPPAPEVADLITEDDAHEDVDWREHHIVGFGADRGTTQEADVESDEFEEQNLDDLNAEAYYDERETGTPAAELRSDEDEQETT